MANSYSFNQIATILNQIVADAQGRTASIATTPRDTSEFVTMATTALSMGTDPIMHSLSQLLNKSIFAARPYNGLFSIMEWDNVTWGNAVRKVTPIFTDSASDSPQYDSQPADGLATDQWTIKRPKVLTTHFVGAEQYQIQEPTVFENQLRSAFRGPDELMQFLSSQRTAVMNEVEQQKEQLARMTCASFIAAKITSDSASVIHLLTEYNAATGLTLDSQSVYQPGNFEAFIRWSSARMREIAVLMRERSTKFHQGITGYTILRHTPRDYQRCIVFSKAMGQIDSMVRNTLFNNWLDLPNTAEVAFWQNINAPDAINITPPIMSASGTISKGSAVAQNNIFAVLYDRDAMGYSIFNEGMRSTPINAKGAYYNTFHTMVKRYMLDMTENGVVFLLD